MKQSNRIVILTNVNLDLLIQSLSKKYQVFGQYGFDQWIQNIMIPDRMSDFKPSEIFVILDGTSLFRNVDDIEGSSQDLKKYFNYIETLAQNYLTTPIYVSNIDIAHKKIMAIDYQRPENKIISLWDEKLKRITEQYNNIHLFDLRSMIEDVGRFNFYSDKMWYMGSIPYSLKGINSVLEEIEQRINIKYVMRKKVLIIDLDNTIWGGVIGEDGIEGITLSTSGIGAAYRDAQVRIKDLAENGILLAVVSKNDRNTVDEVFKNHPQMFLKENDFVSIYANWEPKEENIKSISKELNLSLDSFVFLDDNPVERESVKIALPDVTVIDFPKDISNLPKTINKIAKEYFLSESLTKEDFQRTEQYRQEAERKIAETKYNSIDDYLKSLEIKIVIEEIKETQFERVSQLTQKTNQFNLVTNRYTVEELKRYASAPGNYIYVASVSDKYGDSGLVFILMLSSSSNIAYIDNLLMSCRVMGRFIENAVIESVEKKLSENGIKTINAKYKRTDKNKPVSSLLENQGYTLINEINDQVKVYVKNIAESTSVKNILYKPIWR